MSSNKNSKRIEFGDYLSSINYSKTPLMDDDPLGDVEKGYPAYIANRLFSYHSDMIFYVSAINAYPEMSNKMQFDFYRLSVPKRKRFSRLEKEEKTLVANINLVSDYYNVNNMRAREILNMMSEQDIADMTEEMSHGGRKK